MKAKDQFEKHYPRIRREALLKSLLWGLAAGFTACFAAALVAWFTSLSAILLSAAAFVSVTAVTSLLLFFIKFRPSLLASARRLDKMGLEERTVTMIEFMNDESEMAQIQRNDAKAALESLDKKQIRFNLSKKLIVCMAVSCFLGLAMATVSILGQMGMLPTGNELIEGIMPEEMEVFVSVTYLVEEGGTIEGETDQLVSLGSNAEPVLAVADEGYVFIGWDDGELYPARTDVGVVKDIVVMAVFELIEEEADEDEKEGDSGDQGGEDQSGEPQNNQGDSNQQQQPEDEQQKPEDSDSKYGGGKYDDFNQIIDGKTYYRDHLESYKADIEKFLKEHGDELTEEEKEIILAYIGIV